ncbi:MAG: hypothetical protein DLM73_11295 [Chthoniobacterales bacterium]|nr:MAG: hypothetical protein DLM73_11295 [Chthoniobacterales bacterium]
MNILTTLKLLTVFCASASVALAQTPSTKSSPATATTTTASSPATTTTTTTSAAPSADEMKQMMELAKLNENHKLLASMAGTWSYTVKMWMAPGAPPSESTGTAVRTAVMDGRYLTGDYTGKFKMPGADGKMMEMNFKGMSMDGYDNVKKKFISGWVDNMGTGIMLSEGTYDAAAKTFTYTGEYEAMPGMKSKVRELVKMPDGTHMSMEYYEDRGQGETKSMEITYTRTK